MESTWTLQKYTNLNGRRQEFLPPLGNLYVTVNKGRRFMSVLNGVAVLEEVCLISVPPPLVKSRERDVYVHASARTGAILAKFRLKFISASDHAAFTELLSQYVDVADCNSESAISSSRQKSCSQRFEFSAPVIENRKRTNELPVSDIQPKKFLNEVCPLQAIQPTEQVVPALSETSSNGTLRPSFARGFASQTIYTAEQVVPSLSETLNSTQMTMDDSLVSESQNSLTYSQILQDSCDSLVDVSTQTESLLSVEDLLNNEALLRRKVFSRVADAPFRALVNKCSNLFKEYVSITQGNSGTGKVANGGTTSVPCSQDEFSQVSAPLEDLLKKYNL